MKKEPLYVTMGVNGGSKGNDPIEDSRIKGTKNVAIRNHHPHVREANSSSSNATQQIQSKTNKEAKSVQTAHEKIAKKAEESRYVGICKRFPKRDTNRKTNSVQDSKTEQSADMMSRWGSGTMMCKQNGQGTAHLLDANGASRDCDTRKTNGQRNNKEEMNDNIFNGFHPRQTKTEVNGSKVAKASLLDLGGVSNGQMNGKWVEGEVNCGDASEAGDGAGGMEGNAGEGQELTQQDRGGTSDGGNEEENTEEEKGEKKKGKEEKKEKWDEKHEEGGVKSDGCNETRKGAGHSPHQNNPTKGLAAREEGKQNNCNGRDNSGSPSESSKLESFLAQFEALEREDQVTYYHV